MARPYKQKTIADMVNHVTFIDIYNRLRLIAKTMFEWKGLPDKINTRFIENCLYHYGHCAFYDDDEFGLMVARCNTCDIQNIYDEPIEVQTYSTDPSYHTKRLRVDKDCILIRNNIEMIPTDYTIQIFAHRLYECQRSTDVNIMNQKFPYFILCDKDQVFTFKQIYEKLSGNEPAIFADKALNPESFKVLETNSPFVADKLTIQKHEIWNEAMTFLGLNNANTDKKERLITDEVNSNNELIEMMSEVMLHQRQEACELINKMFGEKYGFKASVELRTFKKEELECPNGDNKPTNPSDKEGDE